MKSLYWSIKREFFEYRRSIVVGAVVLSVLFTLSTYTGIVAGNHLLEGGMLNSADFSISIDEDTQIKSEQFLVQSVDKQMATTIHIGQKLTMMVLLGYGWVLAAIYLLAAMKRDEMDNNLLFWKSMPISDGLSVLAKFFMGCFVLPSGVLMVGFLINLALSVVLFPLASWYVQSDLTLALSHFSFAHELSEPLKQLVGSTLWSMPFAALLLLASSAAKRSPVLCLLAGAFIINVLEKITFKTEYIGQFFYSHLPWGLPMAMHSMTGQQVAVSATVGLLVAVILLWIAASIRRYRI